MVYKEYLIRHFLKWEASVYMGFIKNWYLHPQCLIWIPQISVFSATVPWRQFTSGFPHAKPANNSHEEWLVFRCYRLNTIKYTGKKFQLRCFHGDRHDSMKISTAFYLFSLKILFFLRVFICFGCWHFVMFCLISIRSCFYFPF